MELFRPVLGVCSNIFGSNKEENWKTEWGKNDAWVLKEHKQQFIRFECLLNGYLLRENVGKKSQVERYEHIKCAHESVKAILPNILNLTWKEFASNWESESVKDFIVIFLFEIFWISKKRTIQQRMGKTKIHSYVQGAWGMKKKNWIKLCKFFSMCLSYLQ